MSLEYHVSSRYENLAKAMNEYAVWFNDVVYVLFYTSQNMKFGVNLKKPSFFSEWAEQQKELNVDFFHYVLDELLMQQEDMFGVHERILSETLKSGLAPDYEDFHSFVSSYEKFFLGLSALKDQVMREERGYDVTIGLKSAQMLESDLEKEFEKLSRYGIKFSLALLRLDSYDALKAVVSPDTVQEYLVLVGGLIKRCLRSFDDAYYTRENEFLMCLRQSEGAGGIALLDRIRGEVEQANLYFDMDGGMCKVTVSCCVVEPVAGYRIDELIRDLRVGLENMERMEGSLIKCREVSPLQKYIESIGG